MKEKNGLVVSLKERAQKLRVDIPAVFLALKAKGTPVPAKVFAALTIIYALSPIDLIPDFIPIIGYLDDLIILPALIVLTVKCIPAEQMAVYREQSAGMWAEGKPKKWYYGIPFALIWILIIWLIVKAIWL